MLWCADQDSAGLCTRQVVRVNMSWCMSLMSSCVALAINTCSAKWHAEHVRICQLQTQSVHRPSQQLIGKRRQERPTSKENCEGEQDADDRPDEAIPDAQQGHNQRLRFCTEPRTREGAAGEPKCCKVGHSPVAEVLPQVVRHKDGLGLALECDLHERKQIQPRSYIPQHLHEICTTRSNAADIPVPQVFTYLDSCIHGVAQLGDDDAVQCPGDGAVMQVRS